MDIVIYRLHGVKRRLPGEAAALFWLQSLEASLGPARDYGDAAFASHGLDIFLLRFLVSPEQPGDREQIYACLRQVRGVGVPPMPISA